MDKASKAQGHVKLMFLPRLHKTDSFPIHIFFTDDNNGSKNAPDALREDRLHVSPADVQW